MMSEPGDEFKELIKAYYFGWMAQSFGAFDGVLEVGKLGRRG